MYSVYSYGGMIADDLRTGVYARALCIAVKPGSVVVDIGTGTGFKELVPHTDSANIGKLCEIKIKRF